MEIFDKSLLPCDPVTLQILQDALYRSDDSPTRERRRRLLNDAATAIARQQRDPVDAIRRANHYQLVRSTLLAAWSNVPFEVRMHLREMMLTILRYETQFGQLADDDQRELIEALPEPTREVFMFARVQNWLMANDIWVKVAEDGELRGAPTAGHVWDVIKRLDPKMEEALQRSLDPSKFVARDLEKTPRRRMR
jgi:hypothetical protein